MVIGISGCTALLVTGFGIRDSVMDIADQQFGEIQTFDLDITLKNGVQDVGDIIKGVQISLYAPPSSSTKPLRAFFQKLWMKVQIQSSKTPTFDTKNVESERFSVFGSLSQSFFQFKTSKRGVFYSFS